ncbi:MAG TPA: methyltransferase domain-containing protein [Candidatus Omnitrophota bacterium]|nr:methyltransferase domain-containing protein [Candidatus Omnitrophota bacterium]
MGDVNQVEFICKNADLIKGPILEIGSKDYGNTPDYRPLFPSERYLGCDLEPGKGVDFVLDLSGDAKTVKKSLSGMTFGTILCLSVLEHCPNVFQMCSNIERLLVPGGILIVSVPFVWEYHQFPDDYWRFSPSAIKFLFKGLTFLDDRSMMSTSNPGEMGPINHEYFKIDMAPSSGLKKKRYGMTTAVLIKLFRKVPAFKPVLDHIYLMPPVGIHMVGKKVMTLNATNPSDDKRKK